MNFSQFPNQTNRKEVNDSDLNNDYILQNFEKEYAKLFEDQHWQIVQELRKG